MNLKAVQVGDLDEKSKESWLLMSAAERHFDERNAHDRRVHVIAYLCFGQAHGFIKTQVLVFQKNFAGVLSTWQVVLSGERVKRTGGAA